MVNGPSPSHSVIINIEVDGSHHLRERKKRFFMLRDKYLKSQGVVIERIDVPFLQKMKNDDSLRDWLLKIVANAKDSISN
jgi:very-short-patch-repair endonuclease